jgi:histidine phosphotransfer protein HptB
MVDTARAKTIIITVDRELERLIPAYVENRWLDVDALADALHRRDLDEAREIGRTLRGSAIFYGLADLAQFGEAIERAAATGVAGDVARRARDLQTYLQRLQIMYQ